MITKTQIGFLILVILTSSIYIILPEQARIDIQPTKSIFSVYENDNLVVSGIEWVNLFDGTKKMRANKRTIREELSGNYINIYRTANYKDNISVYETYRFLSNTLDITLFPISHEINIYNAKGKLFQYEVTKLQYTGETIKDINSPQSFGHQMKIEWQDGNYYSRIYKYKYQDKGKLTIKYKIDSSDVNYKVRLFDPPEPCYQETANESTACGGLNTGSYTIDSAGITDVGNMYNGNWSSYATLDIGSTYYFYVNYTILSNINQSNTTIKFKSGISGNTYTKTLPLVCSNNNDVNLTYELRFVSIIDYKTAIYCYNGTDHVKIYDSMEGGLTNIFYEEAIWWDMLIVPDITTYINSSSNSVFNELGNIVNISAFNTDSSALGTMCLSINHLDYGDDFYCNTSTYFAQADLNFTVNKIDEFNDSSTEKNLSYSGIENQTVYLRSHANNNITGLQLNLTGIDVGDYPTYYKIYVNDTLTNSFTGTLEPGIKTEDEFNGLGTETNLTFSSLTSQTVYVDINKNADIQTATFNISGFLLNIEGLYINSWSTWIVGQTNTQIVITTDGTNIWTLDYNAQKVYKWSILGIYDTSWSTVSCGGSVQDITTDGINIFIISQTEKDVCKFSMTGSYISSWSFAAHGSANRIATDGSNIWTMAGNTVYKWSMAGSYINSWTLQTSVGYGITTDGTNIWVTETNEYTMTYIYKYDMNGNYISKWYSQRSGGYYKYLYDLTTDGINIWLISDYFNTVWKYYADVDSYPNNATIDVEADGSLEYQGIGEFNETNSPQTINDFTSNITHYLADCTADSNGDCQVPIRVGTDALGKIELSNLNITYDLNFNPITISATTLNDYIDEFINEEINIPIKIETDQGNITVNALNYSFYGDFNYTINATYENASFASNGSDTNIIKSIWSNFETTYPRLVSWIFFRPRTNNEKNVTPFGQTTTQPIINVSYLAENQSFNASFYLNSSLNSCINLTMSNTSLKVDGMLINTTEIFNITNISQGETKGIWMWADLFSCNYSAYRYILPEIKRQTKCYECI